MGLTCPRWDTTSTSSGPHRRAFGNEDERADGDLGCVPGDGRKRISLRVASPMELVRNRGGMGGDRVGRAGRILRVLRRVESKTAADVGILWDTAAGGHEQWGARRRDERRCRRCLQILYRAQTRRVPGGV